MSQDGYIESRKYIFKIFEFSDLGIERYLTL